MLAVGPIGPQYCLLFAWKVVPRIIKSLKRKEIASMAAGKVEIVMDEEKVVLTKHMVLNLEGNRKIN